MRFEARSHGQQRHTDRCCRQEKSQNERAAIPIRIDDRQLVRPRVERTKAIYHLCNRRPRTVRALAASELRPLAFYVLLEWRDRELHVWNSSICHNVAKSLP